MENVMLLLTYAVGQYGRDRIYSVTFGASTPIVRVYEDEIRLADLWMINNDIQQKKFY